MQEIKSKPATIDEYIAEHPPRIQDILQQIRLTIHEAAPEAEEAISYAMPTFKLKGNLVHFAVFKNHIGFYPTPSGVEKFKEELRDFTTSKGAIQLPIEQPVPFDLIRRITAFRVKENLEKASKKPS